MCAERTSAHPGMKCEVLSNVLAKIGLVIMIHNSDFHYSTSCMIFNTSYISQTDENSMKHIHGVPSGCRIVFASD
jgi:hypothetical protein